MWCSCGVFDKYLSIHYRLSSTLAMNSSAAQLFTDHDLYLGVWTNWSRGRIRGATLTVSRRNGGLLTAFLALFVGTAGTSFWRIGCFFIHRFLSSKIARDAVYHQRQVILRNASSSSSGLWAFLKACWAWRRNGLAPYRRLLPSILFAILTLIAFMVAGIFSSTVATSMGQEVLLRGSRCGSWRPGVEEDFIVFQPYLAKRTAWSMGYAQRCYRNNANSRDCAIFLQPRLQWTTDRNATCPFPGRDDICLSNFGNLRLDSGYIDSARDLGMNSPPENRFLYRSVVECAPLQTQRYSRNTTFVSQNQSYVIVDKDSTKPPTARDMTEYFYGQSTGLKLDFNSTYQYSSARLYGVNRALGTAETAANDYTLR